MDNQSKNMGIIVAGVALFVVIAVAAVFLIIASNEDDNDSETQTEQVAEDNIVETAQATPTLSTLVDAVVAADLVDALSDESASLTVFAPTNDAFAEIEDTVATLLLPENQTDLVNVLQYHVVPSEVLSSQLTDGQVVETLNGETLKVRIVDGTVYINNAIVTTPDVQTSNGIVHVIDQVLVSGEFGNVVETAQDTTVLSTLVDAVVAGDLVDVLSDESANYTVFAPTNEAFTNIQSTVDTLLQPANQADLVNVLQYHVVASEVFSSELTDGQVVETLSGETLTVEIEDGVVYINANNSRARVSSADIITSNGIVHVITEVLVP